MKPVCILVVTLLLGACGPYHASQADEFQANVEALLPAGTPMAKSVAALEAKGFRCAAPRAGRDRASPPGDAVCLRDETVLEKVGASHWRVDLRSDGSGALKSVSAKISTT